MVPQYRDIYTHVINSRRTVKIMHNPTWFLSTSPRMRYLTGALAYFAQGIPKGLLHITLPAWLAVEGVAPAERALGGLAGMTQRDSVREHPIDPALE